MNTGAKRYGLLPEVYARMVATNPPPPVLSGSQARVARGLLGWSQADVAKRAKVPLDTIRELEGDKSLPVGTLQRVRHVFEAARVEIRGKASPRLRA